VFADKVIEDLLRNVGSRIQHQLWAVLDDKPEAVVTSIEDLGQRLQVRRFEQ
jgi:hypothetical protein